MDGYISSVWYVPFFVISLFISLSVISSRVIRDEGVKMGFEEWTAKDNTAIDGLRPQCVFRERRQASRRV